MIDMAIWLPIKAKPHEMKDNRALKNVSRKARFCRICGKPIMEGGCCQTCSDIMRRKRHKVNKEDNADIDRTGQ